MVQEYDDSVNPKIEAANAEFAALMPKMVEAVQATADLARANGLGQLEKSASGLVEATVSLKQVFQEMIECGEKLMEYNKRIAEAIG